MLPFVALPSYFLLYGLNFAIFVGDYCKNSDEKVKMVSSTKPHLWGRILLLSFLLFGLISPALAGEGYGANVGEKLGRGLVNVATGWVEIPKNIVNTSQDSNVGIGVTWGLAKGIGHTIGRTLVGAGELATFFVPTPAIIHPPYVFEDFYRDTTYGAAP